MYVFCILCQKKFWIKQPFYFVKIWWSLLICSNLKGVDWFLYICIFISDWIYFILWKKSWISRNLMWECLINIENLGSLCLFGKLVIWAYNIQIYGFTSLLWVLDDNVILNVVMLFSLKRSFVLRLEYKVDLILKVIRVNNYFFI